VLLAPTVLLALLGSTVLLFLGKSLEEYLVDLLE
jgi:hypothetical protein